MLERDKELPFVFRDKINPHITLLDIENDDFGRYAVWFLLNLDRVGMMWETRCMQLDRLDALEVDTSKVQIWGKIDGKKQLIVEV